MESQTLTITAPLLLTMLYNRGLFWPANSFHFMLVLSCTFFVLATCGPCLIDGMKKSAEYDACRSYGGYQGAGLHDVVVGDTNMGYVIRTSVTHLNIENICTSSNSFCFPSTLPGLFSEDHKPRENSLEVSRIQSDDSLPVGSTETRKIASNKTWSSDYGTFGLLNGKTVSCSLNFKERIHELSSIQTDCGDQSDFSSCRGTSLNQHSTDVRLNMKSEMSKPGSFDTSSSPNVEISPPVLDWGHKNLFFPSVAFLTVANSCNDSILHVYEPFSTNAQFYPCNFSEILLEPREVASICFVFLPRWLGLSESQLILQTSSGGFLVSAKGFGIESPYKIQPLMDLDVPSSGRLSKNLSLFNPFDETLQVKEVTAWVSVSLGNTTYQTEANCGVGHFLNSDETNLLSVKDWLVVDSGQVGSLLMAMRPHTNWGIGSRSSESIVEIDFSLGLEGKILGAFCLQLIRSSQNISDTVIVPLEVDLDRRAAYGDLIGPVLVSLQSLVAQDTGGTVVSISLRNRASYMLNLVSISEVADTKLFQIKYMEGLLLFPGTVTEVAVISCTQLPVELHKSYPEVSNMNRNCKLFLLINDSSSPQIEIPCQDIIHVCSRHQKDSTIGYEYKAGSVKSGNARTGSLGDGVKLPSEIEALETAEADELVLTNWKSQGLTIGMSVLDDHEVLFPMVQVGNHHSKWITVKNPSHHPVVMQLILNSGEIIDGCRGTDGLIQPPSSGSLEFTRPTRYGFSIAESAVTEAFVHPHSSASFGPILFTPSDRCAWRSSALIRNNLSGVEWVPLRGCGGLLSLVLLEGSEPIESVEFSLDLPVTHNVTPDMLFQVEDTRYACSQPLSKELYVKNAGDLPLEVRSIRISGTECGLDGFRVHTCRGFLLEPGESTTLLISYQTDFSAAMVHRDLELTLATGIFVIPIKANLPVKMLNVCKKSVFWRLRKFSIAIIFAACVITLVFYFLYPQVMATGSPDCIYTDEKHSINTTRIAGKSSHVHCYQRNGKSSVPSERECLLSSVGKGKTSKQASVDGYCESKKESQEQNVNAQPAEKTLENHTHANGFSDTLGKRGLLSLPSKPVAEDSDTVEASQTDNLTVRTGKEKARRRRKKKGACTGVTGLLEVSSSQSGNSTPSSPLSPITPLTSTRTGVASPDFNQSTESRNPVTHIADQHCQKVQVPEPMSQAKKLKPQLSPVKSFEPPLSQAKVLEPQLSQPKLLEPHLSQAEVLDPHLPGRHCNNNWYISTPAQSRVASKPVLLPSATFPCAGKAVRSAVCSTSPLTSTSTVAPHARAPGSKIYDQKTVKGEPAGLRDEYTYDIWGDHFSGLGLMGSSKDATAVNSSAMVTHSDSFFVSGPQDLRTDSQSRSVSCSNDEG